MASRGEVDRGAQVNRTVQDLKAIESAALTFKDTYGRLPGDIVNPGARLPNCTVTPCATGGNGDRILDIAIGINDAITPTSERFTFWHHLQAADLLSIGTKNTTDMTFGEGQPNSGVGAGMRINRYNGNPFISVVGAHPIKEAFIYTRNEPSAAWTATEVSVECKTVENIDRKMDDGMPWTGLLVGGYCGGATVDTPYLTAGSGLFIYDFNGF